MQLRPTLKPELKISPRLILANILLQLSSLELDQAVAQELNENPALEAEEGFRCPRCGQLSASPLCPYCTESTSEPSEMRFDWADFSYEGGTLGDDAENFDVFSQVAADVSLVDYLKAQARLLLVHEDLPLASHLVESLDEHGYLGCDLDELASQCGVSSSKVEQVLKQIQQLDPPGIGARNLRECLCLQLQQLQAEGISNAWAQTIISDHLNALARHDYRGIARKLGTTEEEIAESASFIQNNLLPYPAQAYKGPPWQRPGEGALYVRPDIVITPAGEGEEEPYRVEIWEAERYALRVSSFYERLALQAKRGESTFSQQERQHILGSLERARRFLDCLRQRWLTLERIAGYLAEVQAEFLACGQRALRPLTRAEVADTLGLHESTVSRAVANKYAQLPNGQIIPMSEFFDSSLAIKDVIQELIANEETPLSDQAITDKLTAMGYSIARRTVTKYRRAMRVLPARLRQAVGSTHG
jgi:RNA polymerase sigma-54 factor